MPDVPVYTVEVESLPGGLAMLVDDQPESVVIWYRTDLTAGEVVEMLARVWETNAAHKNWTRAAA